MSAMTAAAGPAAAGPAAAGQLSPAVHGVHGVHRVAQFDEDPTKRIQLVPTLPSTSSPHSSAVIQPARYGSMWLRVRDDAVTLHDFQDWLAECETSASGAV